MTCPSRFIIFPFDSIPAPANLAAFLKLNASSYWRAQFNVEAPTVLTNTEPFTNIDIFNVPLPLMVVKALLMVAVDLALTAET